MTHQTDSREKFTAALAGMPAQDRNWRPEGEHTSAIAIARAQQCLDAAGDDNLPNDIAALDDGGVQFDWDMPGVAVEIEFHEDTIGVMVLGLEDKEAEMEIDIPIALCGEETEVERLREALTTIGAWQVDPSGQHGDPSFKALWECKRIAAEALGKAGPDSHKEK